MHDCGKNKRLLNMTVMHNGVGTCSTLASTDPKDAMHLPSQYSTDPSGCATSNSVCAKKITICGTPTPGQLQQCAVDVAQVQCDQNSTHEYPCQYVHQVHVKYICYGCCA